MKTVRVNIRCNSVGKIRRETRDGREKIIVPSATLPDDVVMNGITYPASEIEASYKTLEGTPAPLGHPALNGKFCPANHTEAFIRNGIGAFNENVRRENGRVWLDKVIDVQFAQMTEGGKALLNALDKGNPIHTSTGLLCQIDNADGKKTARNIYFDHDAILMDEPGAATPEQGVGLLVNAAVANGEDVDVINSAIDDAERELDWAVDSAARALERMDRAPVLERIKAAIMGAVKGVEREPSVNKKDDAMPITDEQFKALSDRVEALSDGVDKIPETISNALKPLIDAQVAATNAAKATEEAEKADLVAKIVSAKLMDEDTAKELSLASLKKQAAMIGNRAAAPLVGQGYRGNAKEIGFKLPKSEGK